MQILVQLVPTFEYILQVEIYICTLNSHTLKVSSICNMYHFKSEGKILCLKNTFKLSCYKSQKEIEIQ
jgi:hypothetical protein